MAYFLEYLLFLLGIGDIVLRTKFLEFGICAIL